MDRDQLMELIRQGAVRVRMNSGETYDIPNLEWAVVDDLCAYVVIRDDEGKIKGKLLSLVCMESAENLEPAA